MDINTYISEVGGLFAGGELDMDAVMKSLTEAYWTRRKRTRSTYIRSKVKHQ